MPSRVTFAEDVAGLPAVRLALDDAQRRAGTTLRILLAGPPGTGKTLAATAIAAALNVPAVRYGEILNEYVGVAERNMARANQILRAMAPLVLFIDEADQVGLGARGNMARSSEVHQNLRASLFEFLGDTGEQTGITVVATTNVPMQLDDAALSRFTVLPVLFASAAELAQIMAIHARRLEITLDGDLAQRDDRLHGGRRRAQRAQRRATARGRPRTGAAGIRAPWSALSMSAAPWTAGSAATGPRRPSTPRCRLCSVRGTRMPGPGSPRAGLARDTSCPSTSSPIAPVPGSSTSGRCANASQNSVPTTPSAAMAEPYRDVRTGATHPDRDWIAPGARRPGPLGGSRPSHADQLGARRRRDRRRRGGLRRAVQRPAGPAHAVRHLCPAGRAAGHWGTAGRRGSLRARSTGHRGLAAIASLGAVPVGVAMDPTTLTLDPAAAAKARTRRTRAVIACHLHGICADIPALRGLLPGVGILEDAAQAFGCRLDGLPAGSLGDVAVFSLGPGKLIDAAEGGVLACGDAGTHRAAMGLACHPLRQLVAGMPDADPWALAMRPHPMTAVLALDALAGWSPGPARRAYAQIRRLLTVDGRLRPLGDESRHLVNRGYVPVLLPDDHDQAEGDSPEPPPGLWWTRSGAQVLPCIRADGQEPAARLLARVRLATQRNPAADDGDHDPQRRTSELP